MKFSITFEGEDITSIKEGQDICVEAMRERFGGNFRWVSVHVDKEKIKKELRRIAMMKCQHCHSEFNDGWTWWVCSHCGFRVCVNCLDKHSGTYGTGQKCSQCVQGQMRPKS